MKFIIMILPFIILPINCFSDYPIPPSLELYSNYKIPMEIDDEIVFTPFYLSIKTYSLNQSLNSLLTDQESIHFLAECYKYMVDEDLESFEKVSDFKNRTKEQFLQFMDFIRFPDEPFITRYFKVGNYTIISAYSKQKNKTILFPVKKDGDEYFLEFQPIMDDLMQILETMYWHKSNLPVFENHMLVNDVYFELPFNEEQNGENKVYISFKDELKDIADEEYSNKLENINTLFKKITPETLLEYDRALFSDEVLSNFKKNVQLKSTDRVLKNYLKYICGFYNSGNDKYLIYNDDVVFSFHLDGERDGEMDLKLNIIDKRNGHYRISNFDSISRIIDRLFQNPIVVEKFYKLCMDKL